MTSRTASRRAGRSAAAGSSNRTFAAARVRLARTMRWAIVGVGVRNARATSSVLRPQTSLRVRAERASGDRIGWQAMKISPSRSSARSPSTISSRSCSSACGCEAATRWYLPRWVSRRRIRSTARNRAVVFSQAAGLSGTPSCRHFSIAATKTSWASSSAVSRSPT